MYIKTKKPNLTGSDAENTQMLLCYIESLKEEISFNLENLSKKLDIVKTALSGLSGGGA